MKKETYLLIVFFALMGCAGSHEISEIYQNRKARFSIEAGANSGGIVENTDISKIEDTPADAFSGATRIGYHAGANATIPILRNDLQAGVIYLFSPQTFTYKDSVNGYSGTRRISLSQLTVPVTFNLNLLKRRFDPGTLNLKIGGVFEYNMPSVTNEGSNLTDYSIKKISGGITLGISYLPFQLRDNSKLGLSLDLYKGSQIFDDFYNRKEYKMPSSSYLKFSIIYQFK